MVLEKLQSISKKCLYTLLFMDNSRDILSWFEIYLLYLSLWQSKQTNKADFRLDKCFEPRVHYAFVENDSSPWRMELPHKRTIPSDDSPTNVAICSENFGHWIIYVRTNNFTPQSLHVSRRLVACKEVENLKQTVDLVSSTSKNFSSVPRISQSWILHKIRALPRTCSRVSLQHKYGKH